MTQITWLPTQYSSQYSVEPGRTVVCIGQSEVSDDDYQFVLHKVTNLKSAREIYDSVDLLKSVKDILRQIPACLYVMSYPSGKSYADALQALSDFAVDIIHIVGLVATPETCGYLVDYALEREQYGYPVIFVLEAVSEPEGSSYVDYLLANIPTAALVDNSTEETQYLGRFFVVVPGKVTLSHNRVGKYQQSAAATVAGLLSAYVPHISVTNKPIVGAHIDTDFTSDEHRALSDVGYTTLWKSVGRGPVIYQANTCTPSQSSYHSLVNIRTAHYVLSECRKVISNSGFIGKHTTTDEVEQALTPVLDAMDILQDYDLAVAAGQDGQSMTIALSIVPYYEFVKLQVSAKLLLGQ